MTWKTGLLKNIAALAALFAAVLVSHSYFRLNFSASAPRGLYRITSDPTAPLVEFCPPWAAGVLSMQRGYRHHGACEDGGMPLMKPVVARAGDTVALDARGITVNGKPIPNTAPQERDSEGRPMQPWPFGTYPVNRGQVWVASSYVANSFDSRYFGPIPESAIRKHLKSLLTWSSR